MEDGQETQQREQGAPLPVPSPSPRPCDFTGDEKARLVLLDFKNPPTGYSVGYTRAAQEAFEDAAKAYVESKGWVPFETIQKLVPTLFAPRSWRVRRGDGSEDDGWRMASNFRANWQMNTFRRLRGEPWWRVALEKTEGSKSQIRWTFVHELRELNPSVLADDVWDMLPEHLTLPADGEEPSAEFCEYYSPAAWNLVAPSDTKLAEYKL